MIYKIEFSQEVIKQDLRKLTKHLKNTFVTAIKERIAVRPYDFKPLKGKKYHGIWRLRVGDYRIAYHINEEQNLVIILCIEARDSVYKTLQNRAIK
jgi:addiction module RelE/StbE family toxin